MTQSRKPVEIFEPIRFLEDILQPMSVNNMIELLEERWIHRFSSWKESSYFFSLCAISRLYLRGVLIQFTLRLARSFCPVSRFFNSSVLPHHDTLWHLHSDDIAAPSLRTVSPLDLESSFSQASHSRCFAAA
jgi:hypothetical protein